MSGPRQHRSGKPSFLGSALTAGAVMLIAYGFGAWWIVHHATTGRYPPPFAYAYHNCGSLITHVYPGGRATNLQRCARIIAVNGDARAERTGPGPFIALRPPGAPLYFEVERDGTRQQAVISPHTAMSVPASSISGDLSVGVYTTLSGKQCTQGTDCVLAHRCVHNWVLQMGLHTTNMYVFRLGMAAPLPHAPIVLTKNSGIVAC